MFLRLRRLPGPNQNCFTESRPPAPPQAKKLELDGARPRDFLLLDFLFVSWAAGRTKFHFSHAIVAPRLTKHPLIPFARPPGVWPLHGGKRRWASRPCPRIACLAVVIPDFVMLFLPSPLPFRKASKSVPQISGIPRKDARRRADSDFAILDKIRLLWTLFVTRS